MELTNAMLLPFWAHWLIGGVAAVFCLFIAEPFKVIANPIAIPLAFAAFGWVAGVISMVVAMHLIPTPYAWLAKRLGLSPAV